MNLRNVLVTAIMICPLALSPTSLYAGSLHDANNTIQSNKAISGGGSCEEVTNYIDEEGPGTVCYEDIDSESEKYGNLDILTQLVHAEAGNQDLLGKRLVVDTVLNRVESPLFPNTIEEVIFQPGQFTCVRNGSFNKAAWRITSEDYIAVRMEVLGEKHNSNVLYFSRGKSSFAKTNTFKWGDHWFGY